MIILKKLFFCLFFIVINNISLHAEISPSAPATNTLQSMGASFSFSNSTPVAPEIASQIQTIAATEVNRQQLVAAVEKDAETLGLKVDRALLASMSGDNKASEYIAVAGKNKFSGRTDLEPTLDTYVYDTGLVDLELEAGYNQDGTNTIFSQTAGDQQGRVKIYIDFKRQVQWGDVSSIVTLNGDAKGTLRTLADAGASAVTSIPIDRQLSYTIVNGAIPDQDNAGPQDKHTINSLKLASGGMATFNDEAAFQETSSATEQLFAMQSISHASGADDLGDVRVGAQFQTATSGAAGTSTISFEASGATAPSSVTDSTKATYLNGLVRYSKTVTTEAKKWTGPKRSLK
jgi:hypothetical protein